ncbi:SEC-C metal-binding domain-containing protein, partial [Micromonospora carbonacea]|uniref:SEC-C metal-binding domain-containing protein n=3 Tax=Micromonosporaceae TaxID=28056 RepID=UPI0033E0F069
AAFGGSGQATAASSARRVAPGQADASGSTSRNAPCPCGSGRKYKRCHGAANGGN